MMYCSKCGTPMVKITETWDSKRGKKAEIYSCKNCKNVVAVEQE